jgi:hypothetical protein
MQLLTGLASIAFVILKMIFSFVIGVFYIGAPLWPFLAYRLGKKYSRPCLGISKLLFFIPLFLIFLLFSEPYFSQRDPSMPDGGGASLVLAIGLCMNFIFIAIGLFLGAKKSQRLAQSTLTHHSSGTG